MNLEQTKKKYICHPVTVRVGRQAKVLLYPSFFTF